MYGANAQVVTGEEETLTLAAPPPVGLAAAHQIVGKNIAAAGTVVVGASRGASAKIVTGEE